MRTQVFAATLAVLLTLTACDGGGDGSSDDCESGITRCQDGMVQKCSSHRNQPGSGLLAIKSDRLGGEHNEWVY